MKRTREALKCELQGLIRHKFKIKVDELHDGLRLNEDLAVDSIMIVQLIVFLEVELKLQVPDDQVDPRTFATVGSLLDFMQSLEPYPEEAPDGAQPVEMVNRAW
ncbi:acyl carrier protein [Paenibacillus sp. 1011MAR3C5]|uniref:phosphopantetheine-binding protein n=1 Tax=Paenibacillus sp. 1011MAR3C5 TaxID=1675787 RepID=UPI000E6B9C27|nr:phosphopantetheine-binding protein [Paenibacillus sp. 1011MAR3C5]RJE87793.1 acyl carrier protein [Paenibacillus sp. 1011MAR3C5]